jgi:hypothetical protein
VYSAVIVAILAAALGLGVSALVVNRVYRGHRPRPVVSLLLVALLGLSFSQMLEQTRVLLFRASFDGHIDRGVFYDVYNATWNVAGSKVIMAVSLAAAAALKLGIYCDRSDDTILKWTITSVAGALLTWIALSLILDIFI